MTQYDVYVSNCVEAMNKGASKKQGRGLRGLLRRKRVHQADDGLLVGSIKYSGMRLREKGVIVSVDAVSSSQLRAVTFTVTALEASGHFGVRGAWLGNAFEEEIVLQDLLQMQYDGVQTMKMFDLVKVNVNLLVFLINKKFYGR